MPPKNAAAAKAGPAAGGAAATAATAKNDQETWDEARLKESMDHINDLHIRLRELRTTIPRMLGPLTDKQPGPEALYQSFTQSVKTAHTEVQEFTEIRKDPKTQKILDHAAQRRAEDPKGIKPWNGKDDPHWADSIKR